MFVLQIMERDPHWRKQTLSNHQKRHQGAKEEDRTTSGARIEQCYQTTDQPDNRYKQRRPQNSKRPTSILNHNTPPIQIKATFLLSYRERYFYYLQGDIRRW